MNSRNFRKFKNQIGQANHFLITLMVGLDAVEDGAKKRDSLSTVWNPKDVSISARRSRHYAIKAALAWTVDNLDMYLRLCNKEPKLYDDNASLEIAKTKHSVYNKLMYITEYYKELSADKCAYVDLLICWRNNSVHYEAENQLSESSRKYFNNLPKDDVTVTKYHLDVSKMLERFNANECPTIKEITTLISMTIHFVEELDNILLKKLEQYKFLETFLHKNIKNKGEKSTLFDSANNDHAKRKKVLKQFFATHGILEDFYNDDGKRFIEEVSLLKQSEFEERFNKLNECKDENEKNDEFFMAKAIELAKKAVEHGNEPFGAVLVKNGRIVFTSENQIYTKKDPTFHAESGLIRCFLEETGISDLSDYTLYSSCEPCFMCSGTLIWVKLGRLVYAASNKDLEKILKGTPHDTAEPVFKHSPHTPKLSAGVLRDDSIQVLEKYFETHKKG